LIKANGKKELIKKGQEWYQKKIELGWIQTPDGLLPPNEVEKAGFVYRNGEYVIPMQWYIAESSGFGYKKGMKYLGMSQQYLEWKKNRESYESIDGKIDREISQTTSLDDINF